jgi:hypothetical protein
MSSIDGNAKSMTSDPGLQLAPSENEGPNFNLLKKAFEDCVRDNQPFIDQCRLNYETRYAIWNGQSADGKKHSREGSKVSPTPWDGASDLRCFLVDNIINKKVAMKGMAFKRSNLTAVPVGSEDGSRSQLVSNFMRWMIQTQIPEIEREIEMCANFMDEKGIAVMGQFWEKRKEKVMVSVRLQDLQEQFPAIDIMALLEDKSAADDLKEIFVKQYDCSKGKAGKMLKELRDTGETTVPMDGPERSYPIIRAFNLDEHVFIPSFSTDLEHTPGIYRVEYFTAEQLRACVQTDGWDENWVEAAIQKVRGQLITISPSEYLQPISRSFVYTQQRFTDRIGVVYAYQRLSDEDGTPGIYCTIFNPMLPADQNHNGYAKTGLLGYAHGEYPFVLYRREYLSRKLHDSRGVPEPGKPWQDQIKAHKDSRIDAASLGILPPICYPQGRPPGRWGPGAMISERRPNEYHYADRPIPDMNTNTSETLLEASFKEYNGFASREGDPAIDPIYNQFEVDKFLSCLSRTFRQVWKLYKQYGQDEVMFRVMGVKDTNLQLFNKGDINEEFDFYLSWDVQSTDFKRMSEKWTAIIQAAQSLDRDGIIDYSALCTAFISTIDPNIAERIIRPAQQAQQQLVEDEQQDLTQIFAGIPKNIKPGTPPQFGLQVMEQYLQQPDIQQRYAQDEPFRQRLDTRKKQYEFQMQQQQNAVIGRLGATMPNPTAATASK